MQRIQTDEAPKAVGPYAQAMDCGDTVYCSGQLGLNPHTMELVQGGVKAQALQALANMDAVLRAAGLTREQVAKTTIFLTDMADFPVVNTVYAEFMGEHRPARSTIQVAGLPLGGLVEVECVALRRAE